MKTYYYIKNYRPGLPVTFTSITYLFMDKFNAPEWLWGVYCAIMVIIWSCLVYAMTKRKGIDVEDFLKYISDKKEVESKLPSFKEKLDKMMNEAKREQASNN